jgi:hypothetical protein
VRAARADDNAQRLRTLAQLRRLHSTGAADLLGYHDFGEFPPGEGWTL